MISQDVPSRGLSLVFHYCWRLEPQVVDGLQVFSFELPTSAYLWGDVGLAQYYT